jgi:hypothetical protein
MNMLNRAGVVAGLLAGLGLSLLAACTPIPGTGDSGGLGGGAVTTGSGASAADLAQWNQESAQLDKARTMFLGTDVQELAAVGNQVFWYDTTSFDFTLARYDDTSKKQLAYTFSIGDGDSDNYRASANLVVTADPSADPVVYHAYDAGAADSEVGNTTMPAPPGAMWDAYAVSGSTVYLVDTSTPGATALLKWIPGSDPTMVTTLESAGATVGEFYDFDVSGNTMIFIESGRLWKMDLAANKATSLMNATQVSGSVDFRSDGVMFATDTDVMFFDYAKDAMVDITTLINANKFQVNATYSTAAQIDQTDFARWNQQVLYVSDLGLFAYDMAHDTITPVLLSPISDSLNVQYRYPVVLDDGTAFITGLTSTDGATGADGPTYLLDLNPILGGG